MMMLTMDGKRQSLDIIYMGLDSGCNRSDSQTGDSALWKSMTSLPPHEKVSSISACLEEGRKRFEMRLCKVDKRLNMLIVSSRYGRGAKHAVDGR